MASGEPRPSIVVTFLPSASWTSVRQEFTASPSRRTVQAPQAPRSHPTFVPVIPHESRSASASVVRGSNRPFVTVPFSVMLTGSPPPADVAAFARSSASTAAPAVAEAMAVVARPLMSPRRVNPPAPSRWSLPSAMTPPEARWTIPLSHGDSLASVDGKCLKSLSLPVFRSDREGLDAHQRPAQDLGRAEGV